MKQEHILSILYDLALITSGESDPSVLTGKFLQRLMFHTNMPLGVYVNDLIPVAEDGEEYAARLLNAIGDPDLTKRLDQEYLLPAEAARGKTPFIKDPQLLAQKLGQQGTWKSGLRLNIGGSAAFILLSPDEIRQDIPWASVFNPVLDNFSHVLSLCQGNAAKTAQLAAANKELESFSYSISHDLRAPLRAIDGFARALHEDYAGTLDRTALNYIDRITAGARRMDMLIDDLLQLSKIGRTTLNCEVVDLSAMATEISDTLHNEEPDCKIEFRIQPGIREKGDSRLLYIALTNLLQNAWKYTRNSDKPCIEFGIAHQDGKAVYFVRDNGVGFDMAYADKLFVAFQRLHGTEFPGTGIGLATVRRIIHRHNGHAWAESKPGKGATFYFTLGELNSNEDD